MQRNPNSFQRPECHSTPSVIFSERVILTTKLGLGVGVISQRTFERNVAIWFESTVNLFQFEK